MPTPFPASVTTWSSSAGAALFEENYQNVRAAGASVRRSGPTFDLKNRNSRVVMEMLLHRQRTNK